MARSACSLLMTGMQVLYQCMMGNFAVILVLLIFVHLGSTFLYT